MTRKSRINYLKSISHNVERKKMYKAKKQWIVAGMSFLVATGLGAVSSHLTTHADVNQTSTQVQKHPASNTLASRDSSATKTVQSVSTKLDSVQSNATHMYRGLMLNAATHPNKSMMQQSSASNSDTNNSSNLSKQNSNQFTGSTVNGSNTTGQKNSNDSVDEDSTNSSNKDSRVGKNNLNKNIPSSAPIYQKAKPNSAYANYLKQMSGNSTYDKLMNNEAKNQNNSVNKHAKLLGDINYFGGNVVKSGSNNGLNYRFYSNGGLEITGGVMQSGVQYFNYDNAPIGSLDGSWLNAKAVKFDGNIDTSKVTDMSYIFNDDLNLQSIDLGNEFNTSNVTSMVNMFYGDGSLRSLNLGNNFNTSKVSDMTSMFYGDRSLRSLNLGNNFNTSKVSGMSSMFNGDGSLQNLNLGNQFNTNNATNMLSMFYGDKNLQSLSLGNQFNTSNVTNMSYMFDADSNLSSLNLGNKFNTSKVTDMSNMFSSDNSLTSLDLGNQFNTSNVTNMSNMFSGDNSLTNLNLGNQFNTGSVSDMSYMFSSDNSLTSLNLGNQFNTSMVINMYNMFSGDNSLTSLNLGNQFNTSDVTDMGSMFSNDSSLNQIIIGSHNTKLINAGLNNNYYKVNSNSDVSDNANDFSQGNTGTFISNPVTDTVTFSDESNNINSETIRAVPNTNITVPCPNGYHYINGSTGAFNSSDQNVNFDIAPNNITLQFSNGSDKNVNTSNSSYYYLLSSGVIPNGYHTVNNEVSLNQVANGGTVSVPLLPNNITLQFSNGLTIPIDISTYDDSDYHVGSDVPNDYHLVSDSNPSVSLKGVNDGASVSVPGTLVPNTINIIYTNNGGTVGSFPNVDTSSCTSDNYTIPDNDLPQNYHTINGNSINISGVSNGGNVKVPVAQNNVSITINYKDGKTGSDKGSFQIQGQPGTQTSINWYDYGSINMPGDWNIDLSKNNNPQFQFQNGTINTVYIEPNTVSDTVTYIYNNGQFSKTVNYSGNNKNVACSQDNITSSNFNANTKMPAGFHATSNTTFTISDDSHTVYITPNQDNDYVDYYYNGHYVTTSPDIQGNDYRTGIDGTFTISSDYAPGLPAASHITNGDGTGTNNLIFNHMNSRHTVNIVPDTVSDTIIYTYDGAPSNYASESSFRGNSYSATYAGNRSFSAEAPVGYQLVPGTNNSFNYDGSSYSLNVEPTSIPTSLEYINNSNSVVGEGMTSVSGSYGTTGSINANAYDNSGAVSLSPGFHVVSNQSWLYNSATPSYETITVSSNVSFNSSISAEKASSSASSSYANLNTTTFSNWASSEWSLANSEKASDNLYYSSSDINSQYDKDSADFTSISNDVVSANDDFSALTSYENELNSAASSYDQSAINDINTAEQGIKNEYTNISSLSSTALATEQNMTATSYSKIPQSEWEAINSSANSIVNSISNANNKANSKNAVQNSYSNNDSGADDIPKISSEDTEDTSLSNDVRTDSSEASSMADSLAAKVANYQSYSADSLSVSASSYLSNDASNSANAMSEYGPTYNLSQSSSNVNYDSSRTYSESVNDHNVLSSSATSISASANDNSADKSNNHEPLITVNSKAELAQSSTANSLSGIISYDSSVMNSASSVISSASIALNSNSNDVADNKTNNRNAAVSYASAIAESTSASNAQSSADSASSQANSARSSMASAEANWIAPITISSASNEVKSADSQSSIAIQDSSQVNFDSSQASADNVSANTDLAKASNNSNYDYSALVSLNSLDNTLSASISADSSNASQEDFDAQSYRNDVYNDYYSDDNAASADANSNSTSSEASAASEAQYDANSRLAEMSSVASQMDKDINLDSASSNASSASLATKSESTATNISDSYAIKFNNSAKTENGSNSERSVNFIIYTQMSSQSSAYQSLSAQIQNEGLLISTQKVDENSLHSEYSSASIKSASTPNNASLSALVRDTSSEAASYSNANISLSNRISSENIMLSNESSGNTSAAIQENSITPSDINNQSKRDSQLASIISSDFKSASSANVVARNNSTLIHSNYAVSMSNNNQSITNNFNSMSSVDVLADQEASLADNAELVALSKQKDATSMSSYLTSTNFNELLSATTQASYATSLTSLDYSKATSISYVAASYAKSSGTDLNGNDIQYQESMDSEFYSSLESYSNAANSDSSLAASASSQATHDTENIGKSGITVSNINSDESNASNYAYQATSNMNQANGAYDLITDRTKPSTKQTVINSDIRHIHMDSSSASTFNGESDQYVASIISGDNSVMSNASYEATQDSYTNNMNDADKQHSLADSAYANASAENIISHDMASDNALIPKAVGIGRLHLVYNIHQGNNNGPIIATRTKTILIPINHKFDNNSLRINPWNYTKPYYNQPNHDWNISFKPSDFVNFKNHNQGTQSDNLNYNPTNTFTYNATQAGPITINYVDTDNTNPTNNVIYHQHLNNIHGLLVGQTVTLSSSNFGGNSDNIFGKLQLPDGYHLANQLTPITLTNSGQQIIGKGTPNSLHNVPNGMILIVAVSRNNSNNTSNSASASTTPTANTNVAPSENSNSSKSASVMPVSTLTSIDTNTPQSNQSQSNTSADANFNLANTLQKQGNDQLQQVNSNAHHELKHMMKHHNTANLTQVNDALYAHIHHAKASRAKLPRIWTIHQLNKVGRNHTVRFDNVVVTNLSGRHSYKFRILKHVYLHKKIYFTHSKFHSLKPSHKAIRVNRIFLVQQGKHTYIRLELRLNHHTYFITGQKYYVKRFHK